LLVLIDDLSTVPLLTLDTERLLHTLAAVSSTTEWENWFEKQYLADRCDKLLTISIRAFSGALYSGYVKRINSRGINNISIVMRVVSTCCRGGESSFLVESAFILHLIGESTMSKILNTDLTSAQSRIEI
jgi:hypothetical protein